MFEESRGMSTSEKINAISWAANRAGMSYGKFSLTLSPADTYRIYQEYKQYLAEKEKNLKPILNNTGI